MPIYISVFTFPILVVLYFVGGLAQYFIVLTCAVIHELGHIAAAVIFKLKIDSVEILPVGICAKIKLLTNRSLNKELILFFAGPMVNCFIAIAALIVTRGIMNEFVIINLGLAVLNLFPILPLDGGKILNSTLSFYYSCYKSYKICIVISKSLNTLILFVSVYAAIYYKNLSYMLVAIFLISYISKNRYLLKSRAMVELMQKGHMFKDGRIMPARIIAAEGDTKLMELIKEFALGYYCLVHVLDEDSKFISETEIIDAVIAIGAEGTLKELKTKGQPCD